MDVARRRESRDFAGVVRAAPDFDEIVAAGVGRVELLVLDSLDHAEHAPCDVIVDRRHLARAPDEGEEREAAVALDVEHVGLIARRVPAALLPRQDVGRRQVALELRRHELGRRLPVGMLLDDTSNRLHQPGQLRRGARCAIPCDDIPAARVHR